MEESVEKMRSLFVELLAVRDENDQGLTQQGMADKLNKENVLSLTGQPWSKYSVRRILKKLSLQTATSASQGRAAPPPPPVQQTGEHQLDESSPLRQWGYYESIRSTIEELTAGDYTTQSLAKTLNEKGIATIDGAAWNKQSVARVLKTLKPGDAGKQFSDEEIRERIRKGHYDTETERFVAIAIKSENKQSEKKGEKKSKKEKKEKKGKSKKK